MSLRATAMSIAVCVNWTATGIVGLCFPLLDSSVGAWALAPFAAGGLVCTLVLAWLLPETCGVHPASFVEPHDNVLEEDRDPIF